MINKDYYVYFHRKSTDVRKVYYVGIGRRYRATQKHGRSNLWYRYYDKYGFVCDKIHEGLTRPQAERLEEFYISMYGRVNNGTGCLANLTNGGEGTKGVAMTEERRRQISKQHTGSQRSEATKEKMRIASLGNKHSEKSKELIGQKSRERGAGGALGEWTAERRDKLSKANSIKVIYKGVEYDSMTNAAKETGVTLSAVSWRIRSHHEDSYKLK